MYLVIFVNENWNWNCPRTKKYTSTPSLGISHFCNNETCIKYKLPTLVVLAWQFLQEKSFLLKSKKGWISLSWFLHNKLPFDVKHLTLKLPSLISKNYSSEQPTMEEIQGPGSLSPATFTSVFQTIKWRWNEFITNSLRQLFFSYSCFY